MQVSFKWLYELVDLASINLDIVLDKLSLGGFEIEEIREVTVADRLQLVVEISATANRSDSLSTQGMGLELSTLLQRPLRRSPYTVPITSWRHRIAGVSHTLSSPSSCSKFISVRVETVGSIQAPLWMQEKLRSSNLPVTHTFADLEHYLLLETGYPFAFYDFSKLSAALGSSEVRLSLSAAKANDTLVGTNGIPYALDPSVQVVKANQHILSVAGVLSNQAYAASAETQSWLIEASLFDAAFVRHQSRQLGVRTDRSARYQKSLHPYYLTEALYRLLTCLKSCNPRVRFYLHTWSEPPAQPSPVLSLRYTAVTEILGPLSGGASVALTPSQITKVLHQLTEEVVYDPRTWSWTVTLPIHRTDDLTSEIDLVEEIGRLYGFDKFVTTLPSFSRRGKPDDSYQIRTKLTNSLLTFGWNEVIHSSLLPASSAPRSNLRLLNPLVSESSSLRSSLLVQWMETTQTNVNQKNVPLEGFEYGHVFHLGESTTFQERDCVGGIFGGTPTKTTWSDVEQPIRWFEAKGKLEDLLQQFQCSTVWQALSDTSVRKPFFHPYRVAEIYLENGTFLGIFGQIHPGVAHQRQLSSELYLWELDLEPLRKISRQPTLGCYQPYSVYPKIRKDLSLILPPHRSFQELQSFLRWNGTHVLEQILLRNEYVEDSPSGPVKSVCVQLVFQSNETTLESTQIETLLQDLQQRLQDHFHAILKG